MFVGCGIDCFTLLRKILHLAYTKALKPTGRNCLQHKKPFESFSDVDEAWCPEMVALPSGSFVMGSPSDEAGREEYEGPQHLVTLSQPFALARHTVTIEQFHHYCLDTGRDQPGDGGWSIPGRPVDTARYSDAQEYCDWLSSKTGETYQLPTEAMWEYACRAGTSTPFSTGSTITTLQANFMGRPAGVFRGLTTPIESFPPNPWGVYDMHGNVFEWCADWFGAYPSHDVADPKGPAHGSKRILRGGAYLDLSQHIRSAFRHAETPSSANGIHGFRCARLLAHHECIGPASISRTVALVTARGRIESMLSKKRLFEATFPLAANLGRRYGPLSWHRLSARVPALLLRYPVGSVLIARDLRFWTMAARWNSS